MIELGERLRRRREAEDLSIQALARASGVDAGYLCRLEQGRGKRTSHAILGKLARVLHAGIGELTGEQETQEPADTRSLLVAQRWARWVAALSDSDIDEHLADLAALSPPGRADCLEYAHWRRQQEISGVGARPWMLAEPLASDPRILGSDPTDPTVERKTS